MTRIDLRPWTLQTRDGFARLCADPEVMAHFPGVLDSTASDALVSRFEAHLAQHGFGVWAVVRRDDGAFIGAVGLQRVGFSAHFTPAVEVLWRLARPFWGCGYATEAAMAACRVGFEEHGLHEIVSMTVPHNDRSRAVMERLGMRRDPSEDFDHPVLPESHPLRRHVLYRLKPEWLSQECA